MTGRRNERGEPQGGPLGVWVSAIDAGPVLEVLALYELLESASSNGLIHGGLKVAVRSEFHKWQPSSFLIVGILFDPLSFPVFRPFSSACIASPLSVHQPRESVHDSKVERQTS